MFLITPNDALDTAANMTWYAVTEYSSPSLDSGRSCVARGDVLARRSLAPVYLSAECARASAKCSRSSPKA